MTEKAGQEKCHPNKNHGFVEICYSNLKMYKLLDVISIKTQLEKDKL